MKKYRSAESKWPSSFLRLEYASKRAYTIERWCENVDWER